MSRCKEKTEVYSRIVGYFRPVQQWNIGKKEEYFNRSEFRVDSPDYADILEFPVIANEQLSDKRISGNLST